jgi:hypothetical protein
MAKDTSGTQELLTVHDLATRLKVPRSWVYSHSADLGAYKLGKYLRFDWERVRERLSKLGSNAPSVRAPLGLSELMGASNELVRGSD